MNLTVVDKSHPSSNRFVTGEKIKESKTSGESKLNDSPVNIPIQVFIIKESGSTVDKLHINKWDYVWLSTIITF